MTCSESLRHGLGTLPQLPAPYGDSNAPDAAKRTAPLPDHSQSLGVASMLLVRVRARVRNGVRVRNGPRVRSGARVWNGVKVRNGARLIGLESELGLWLGSGLGLASRACASRACGLTCRCHSAAASRRPSHPPCRDNCRGGSASAPRRRSKGQAPRADPAGRIG